VVASLLALQGTSLAAQSDAGSVGSAVAGGALGAYSGLFLGDVIGDLASCDECPIFYLGGAAVGGALGAYAGASNSTRVEHGLIGAGIGAAAGALLFEILERTGATATDTGPRWLVGALYGGALGALIGLLVPATSTEPLQSQTSIVQLQLRF
jgi:hypothetical protein